MPKSHRRKPQKQQNIAKQRLHVLFGKAKEVAKQDPSLAKRYVTLARKVAMKARYPIPRELKRRFCRNCGIYWIHGQNCRVRLRNSMVVYYCLECKHFRRFRYKG